MGGAHDFTITPGRTDTPPNRSFARRNRSFGRPRLMAVPRLRHNIAALGALQAANYLIPLVTLPYLTHALGVEAFGRFSFVLAVMAYFVLITDYGFSWSATRQIAAHRDDRQFVSEVFSATWYAKCLLALVSGFMLVGVVGLVPVLREDAGLYLAGFSLVVGNLLMPVWLLQGLERMREVAIIHVFGRIAALLPLFLLVRTPEDVAWAVFYAGAASIIGGIVALFWISHGRLIEWKKPELTSMLNALREGGVLFLSKLYSNSYTLLAPLALGAVSGTTSVGYFALADRIMRVAQALLEPITQALFPRLSHLYGKDRRAARGLVKRTAAIIVVLSGLTSLLLWVSADWMIELLGGGKFAPASDVLRWLAVVPLVMGLSNVLGVQIMLPNGLSRAFSQIAGFAALLGILVISPLVYWKDAQGAAMAILLVELFITFAMGVYLYGRRTRDGREIQSGQDIR